MAKKTKNQPGKENTEDEQASKDQASAEGNKEEKELKEEDNNKDKSEEKAARASADSEVRETGYENQESKDQKSSSEVKDENRTEIKENKHQESKTSNDLNNTTEDQALDLSFKEHHSTNNAADSNNKIEQDSDTNRPNKKAEKQIDKSTNTDLEVKSSLESEGTNNKIEQGSNSGSLQAEVQKAQSAEKNQEENSSKDTEAVKNQETESVNEDQEAKSSSQDQKSKSTNKSQEGKSVNEDHEPKPGKDDGAVIKNQETESVNEGQETKLSTQDQKSQSTNKDLKVKSNVEDDGKNKNKDVESIDEDQDAKSNNQVQEGKSTNEEDKGDKSDEKAEKDESYKKEYKQTASNNANQNVKPSEIVQGALVVNTKILDSKIQETNSSHTIDLGSIHVVSSSDQVEKSDNGENVENKESFITERASTSQEDKINIIAKQIVKEMMEDDAIKELLSEEQEDKTKIKEKRDSNSQDHATKSEEQESQKEPSQESQNLEKESKVSNEEDKPSEDQDQVSVSNDELDTPSKNQNASTFEHKEVQLAETEPAKPIQQQTPKSNKKKRKGKKGKNNTKKSSSKESDVKEQGAQSGNKEYQNTTQVAETTAGQLDNFSLTEVIYKEDPSSNKEAKANGAEDLSTKGKASSSSKNKAQDSKNQNAKSTNEAEAAKVDAKVEQSSKSKNTNKNGASGKSKENYSSQTVSEKDKNGQDKSGNKDLDARIIAEGNQEANNNEQNIAVDLTEDKSKADNESEAAHNEAHADEATDRRAKLNFREDKAAVISYIHNQIVNQTVTEEDIRVITESVMNNSSTQTLIQCFLCSCTLKNPKHLQCIHSFCLECLRKYVDESDEKDKILCPACRHYFHLPAEGVDHLPSNYFIQNLIEIEEKCAIKTEEPPAELKCSICCDEEDVGAQSIPIASSYCLECDQHLCDTCVKSHKRITSTKQHQVRKLNGHREESGLLSATERLRFCPKHSSHPIQLYCLKCEIGTCLICVASEHNGHQFDEIGLTAARYRDLIDLKMKTLHEAVLKSVSAITRLKIMQDIMLEKSERVVEDIRERFDDLRQMLEKFIDQHLSEVRKFRNENMDDMRYEMQDIEFHGKHLVNFMRYLTEMKTRGSNCDLACNGKELLSRAEYLQTLCGNIFNIEHKLSFMYFEVSSKEEFTIQMTGRLNKGNKVFIVIAPAAIESTIDKVYKISLEEKDNVAALKSVRPSIDSESACCTADNNLFSIGIGGCNETWKLVGGYKDWKKVANLPYKQDMHCAASIGDRIFLFGGWTYKEQKAVDTVLCYSLKVNKWADVGRLCHAVHSACCLAFRNQIYVFGGINKDDVVVDHVQIFDESTCRVSLCSTPMPAPQKLMKAILWNSKAFLIGKRTCYIYDFETGEWEERERFKSLLIYFALALDGDRMYMAGGGDRGTDEEGNTYWNLSDKVRSLAVSHFLLDDAGAKWEHHAILPAPAVIYAYSQVPVFIDTKQHSD